MLHRIVYLVFLLVVVPFYTVAQCPTCSASCLTSVGTGNWDDCTKWTGVSCTGWATATIMGNRRQVVQSGHTITVPSTVSTFHGRSAGIYVSSGGTLTISGAVNGNSYSATVVSVAGTLNVTAGNSNFDGATLTVCNGGVVNVSGGQLKVSSIVVEDGGIINISGTGDLARTNRTTGLNIKLGGLININSSTAKLSEVGTIGTRASTIDGTLDVKNSMTSSNQGNVALGDVSVTNNTSTGRIRTQTAYLPSHTTTVPSAAANDFFASNSDYGGTVEYYGGSTISLNSTWSRYYYYDLDINTPVILISETFVRGTLKLRGGNLTLNGKKLNIIGTINYVGSNYIVGDANAEIEFRGKLSTNNSFVSPGMTTYLINSFGMANVNCKNPQLRMSSASLGSATLKTLTINREDVVYVDYSRITINNLLDLKRGIFRTSDTEQGHLYVSLDDSLAVKHVTTGSVSLTSYVSGFLKRKISASKTFDFPVGYVNQTSWFSPSSCVTSTSSTDKHRRISFEVNSMGVASQDLAVRFYNPIDDECIGTLTATQFASTLLSVHPEGYWLSVPSNPAAAVSYNTRLYVQGFSGLTDNYFYTVKRPEATPTCTDWSTYGLPVPAMNQDGRIKVQDATATCLQSGYAKRLDHTEFSHHAIAYSDVALPIELNFFNAACDETSLSFQWQTNSEHNNDYFQIQKSADLTQWEDIGKINGAGNSQNTLDYSIKYHPDKGYFRLTQTDFDGKSSHTAPIFLDCFEESLILAPNPTDKSLYVQLKNNQYINAAISIYSADGRLVLIDNLQGNTATLNLESLESGVYILLIQGVKGSVQERFVKRL